jgi:hypothetical protein
MASVGFAALRTKLDDLGYYQVNQFNVNVSNLGNGMDSLLTFCYQKAPIFPVT